MEDKVVAFCGSKGAGKDTAGRLFEDFLTQRNVFCQRLALAEHLKYSCAKVFAINSDRFIDQNLKEQELPEFVTFDQFNVEAIWKFFGVDTPDYDAFVRPHIGRVFRTPRELLQYVGTEFLQSFDKLILLRDAWKKRKPGILTIVTDMRFVHEFNFFAENSKFFPVFVTNEIAEIRAKADVHVSEKQLNDFKHKCLLLDNNGTLRDLQKKVEILAGGIVW